MNAKIEKKFKNFVFEYTLEFLQDEYESKDRHEYDFVLLNWIDDEDYDPVFDFLRIERVGEKRKNNLRNYLTEINTDHEKKMAWNAFMDYVIKDFIKENKKIIADLKTKKY